jgi:hypothetical protein
VTIVIVSAILGSVTVALGDRAWIVMPPVAFLLMLVMVAVDGRKPITPRWVLGAALMAVAMGVFLKIT